MREALIEDAKRVVANFQSTYTEYADSAAIGQVTEMLEYLVVENQHECLGVAPKSLQDIFDLLRDKIVFAKTDYDELIT